MTTVGNDYNTSSELLMSNINNIWERREPNMNLNDQIHSLTDAHLLNLYDNTERKGLLIIYIKPFIFFLDNTNIQQILRNDMIKPSISLSNFEKIKYLFFNCHEFNF